MRLSVILAIALSSASARSTTLPLPVAGAQPVAMVLKRDTPIQLMVLNEVTTKTAIAGTRFVLLVHVPVVIDGVTLIDRNARAHGEVTSAAESGVLGKAGRLGARLLYLDAPFGRVPLTGDRAAQGPGGAAQTVLGVLGLGVLGLFARGTNAKLKAGEIITGYVAEDVTVPPR